MRIGAGAWRGRVIEAPASSATRPMSDKVRAALFNVVGDIRGYAVLDLYAGSGAVGLEALSRGAAHAIMIEKSRPAVDVIRRNVQGLGAEESVEVVNQPIESWLKSDKTGAFDVIIVDPPYAQLDQSVLEDLCEYLAADGIFVVSHSSKISSPELKSLELVRSKTYGDTALSFYKSP